MMSDSLYEIDKLIKTLSIVNTDTVFLHDVPHDEEEHVLNTLMYCAIDKKLLPSWTSVSYPSVSDSVINIQNIILENISDAALEEKQEHALNYKKKIIAPRIRRKIDEISTIKTRELRQTKTKSKNLILPVLSTVSSFGIALGVPLFSALLFRQASIIEGINGQGSLGVVFFFSMIGIAITLISLAVFSTISILALTVIKNKKELIADSVSTEFHKIIKKYFYLETDNISAKEKKRKIMISRRFVFFYTQIDENHPSYLEFLSLLNIIQELGSKSFLIFNKRINPDDRNLYKNELDKAKVDYVNFGKYKTNMNTKQITNFILYQITLLTGLSSRTLLNKYKLFTNSLYRFLDESSSNMHVLWLLYNMKKMIGSDVSITINKQSIKYFEHLFTICVLKSLNHELFKQIIESLSNNGLISEEVKKNYLFQTLNVEQVFKENMHVYRSESLYFRLLELSSYDLNLKSMIKSNLFKPFAVLDKSKWETEVNASMNSKGYTLSDSIVIEPFDLVWTAEDNKEVVAKYIFDISEDFDVLASMKELLVKAKSKKINYVIFNLYEHTLKFQLIDKEYELIVDFLF